jgi:hypothetical protein
MVLEGKTMGIGESGHSLARAWVQHRASRGETITGQKPVDGAFRVGDHSRACSYFVRAG